MTLIESLVAEGLAKVKTSGTGKAGAKSGRWTTRADAKKSAKKRRRRESKPSRGWDR